VVKFTPSVDRCSNWLAAVLICGVHDSAIWVAETLLRLNCVGAAGADTCVISMSDRRPRRELHRPRHPSAPWAPTAMTKVPVAQTCWPGSRPKARWDRSRYPTQSPTVMSEPS